MTHPVRQAITDDSIQTLFTELKLNVKIPSGVIFNRAFHRENFFYNQSFGKGMKSDGNISHRVVFANNRLTMH